MSQNPADTMQDHEEKMRKREWKRYFAQIDLRMMRSGVMLCLPCMRPWAEEPCCQPKCRERPEAYCTLEDCRRGADI